MEIKSLMETTIFESENGETLYTEKEVKPIIIYVLYNMGSPIYVGQTINIEKRIKDHKKNKIFNECFILSYYYQKEHADIAERAIISAMKFINPRLTNKNTTGKPFKYKTINN